MMGKIYTHGQVEITVSATEKLSIVSDDSCKVYQKVGYPNQPDSWDLLATTTASEQYVSAAFSVGTLVRIEAGADDVEYEAGALADVGAKSGATVTVVEDRTGTIQKTVLTFTATPVTITDDAGVAQYGSTGKIYDLPDGAINFLGCVIDGDLTLGTTGTIITTFAGGIALGTETATTGATLTSTEADIMAEVDVAAATASVAATPAASVASTYIDGTGTAKDVFLNFVVDDDASHTSGTGTFTGTVTMNWINLGDVA